MNILNQMKPVKYTRAKLAFIYLFLVLTFHSNAQVEKTALSPTMGWNSYNSYGATVKESEVLDNAGFMQTNLAPFGWQYVVVDYCWYFPYPGALNDPKQIEGKIPAFKMDKYGRLLPAPDRFPSACGQKGFKSLAKEIHKKGLKFGITIMRGIPRQALVTNTRIKGTKYHAKDIADTTNTCTWLNHMYGIDMDKPGAQAYYNSLFKQYAKWGVDYVKVDDISAPYNEKEIIAIRKAISQCGRPMVLNLSSGETPVNQASLMKEYADSWRISDDFRDNWNNLYRMFSLLHNWESQIGQGHFADADNLNIGIIAQRGPIGEKRRSNLTRNELVTMMTLWSIARSPLMIGGDLTLIHPFELELLQNKAVITVNQSSSNNRQFFRNENDIAWIADIPDSKDKYLAIFNTGEKTELIPVNLKEMGINGSCKVTDLWTGDWLGQFESAMRPEVLSHGARLLRISPNQ